MSEAKPPPAPAGLGRLIQTAKWISWCAGGLSTLLPGASFFMQTAPPLFATTGLLTSGLAVAALIRAYLWPVGGKRALNQAVWLLLLAVVAGAAYVYCLDYLTVQPPGGRSSARYQIGFGTAPWSLTDEGRRLLADESLELKNAQDLMMAVGGFPDGVGKASEIWSAWSIALAGTILICLFLGGFVSLACGFGKLARALSVAPKKEPQPKQAKPPRPRLLRRLVRRGGR